MRVPKWSYVVAVSGALVAALLLDPVSAQSVNIKPGSWQWTVTVSGATPGSAKLPPAVAAQILAEMSKPRTVTDCITPDEVKKGWTGAVSEDDDCKVTSRKITATSLDVVRTCAGDEPRTETQHFEIVSPENIRGSSSFSGGRTGTMTMVGKWLGAACKP